MAQFCRRRSLSSISGKILHVDRSSYLLHVPTFNARSGESVNRHWTVSFLLFSALYVALLGWTASAIVANAIRLADVENGFSLRYFTALCPAYAVAEALFGLTS